MRLFKAAAAAILILIPRWAGASETLRVLSANLGNNDLRCASYNWKLCLKSVEDRVRDSIRALEPDVVALQEISTAAQCEKRSERRPKKVCAQENRTEAEEQTRRILGPGYTIAIAKGRYEAIAVKVSAGTIKGCEPGAICWAGYLPNLPEGCDPGFSISAVDAALKGTEVRVVNVHPDSIKRRCRTLELEQAFALATGPKNLMLGDWNTDPYRGRGEDVEVWKREVAKRPFTVHSGLMEHDPPYWTDLVPWPWPDKTLDHVLSDFARGVCTTLGVAPGTRRLDHDGDLDHRGLLCELTMP
jgi:endonuclease/exonuclease/phosphatase family metal-dependent hydrolase